MRSGLLSPVSLKDNRRPLATDSLIDIKPKTALTSFIKNRENKSVFDTKFNF
jgi:hypothetical protein